jgi:hypothetical protein
MFTCFLLFTCFFMPVCVSISNVDWLGSGGAAKPGLAAPVAATESDSPSPPQQVTAC